MPEQGRAVAVFLSLCVGCGLSTSGDPPAQAGEPGPGSGSAQTPTTAPPVASPPAPAAQPTQAPSSPLKPQVPTEPAASDREPTCGVDWNNARATVPSAFGVVGTVNGRPFALTLDDVQVELDCERAPDQPPPIHVAFALEEEGLVFVIRRCEGIAYLPDGTGIALETDPERTLGTVTQAGAQPTGGHFRLTGRQAPESELLDLEFTLSVPLATPDPLPLCPG